ncbi:MAG: hypothetical protein P4K83_06190 [Terracidiphilus sp.]|nr:hypothetical protein [Terracidiphilus sp.]
MCGSELASRGKHQGWLSGRPLVSLPVSDPKTAQTTLRQSYVAFTLNKYTQTDTEELVVAQNMMLDAIFKAGRLAIQ